MHSPHLKALPAAKPPLTEPRRPTLTRRSVLVRALSLPLAAALPAVLAGCSRGPHCNETGSLSADDAKLRTEVAVYEEQGADPARHCSGCAQFTTGGEGNCGTCKVVKGSINPGGTCKLFVKKAG